MGFAQAGLKPEVAAEIDVDACDTYRSNLDMECDPIDLASDSAPTDLLRYVSGRKTWMVVGGPPCQGFSTAGPRSPGDPRNALIYNYLEIVSRLRPKWFLFENVEGILTSNKGADLVRLVSELIEIGYTVRIEKVNFAGFGLPQTRKRVIILGNRLGLDFDFPAEKFSYNSGKAVSARKLPLSPTIVEAIGDLPAPSRSARSLKYPKLLEGPTFGQFLRAQSGKVGQHFTNPTDAVRALAEALKPGQTMKDLPPELQHASYRRRANRRVSDGTPTERRGGAPSGVKRLRGDLNSLTITSASTREFIHPVEHRPLTLRECARLQSFPDEFLFSGNSASVAKQIGNAIPPLAGKVLADHIMRIDGAAGTGKRKTRNVGPGLLGFRLTDANGMSPALAETHSALSRLVADQPLPLFEAAVA